MAGKYKFVASAEFPSGTTVIDLKHNANRENHTVRVLDGDGNFRTSWISRIVPSEDDPLNHMLVYLTPEASSGFVQVIDTDVWPVGAPGVSELLEMQKASTSGIWDLEEGGRLRVNTSGILHEGDPRVTFLNGLSGVVGIQSGVFGTVSIFPSGNSVVIDVDPAKTEAVLTFSGIAKLATAQDVEFASTTSTNFVQVSELVIDIAESGTYRAQWSFQGSCSQANKRCNFRIQVDDGAEVDNLMNIDTSFNVSDGQLQFGGFAQFGLNAGTHTIDFDHRFADTGGGAVQTENLRVELLRIAN